MGVADTDAAVVGAHQQHSARALLRCAQAAHPPGAVALKHIQLPLRLRPNEGRGDKGHRDGEGGRERNKDRKGRRTRERTRVLKETPHFDEI